MKMAYFLQINCTNSEMVYRRNTETNELEISTVSQKGNFTVAKDEFDQYPSPDVVYESPEAEIFQNGEMQEARFKQQFFTFSILSVDPTSEAAQQEPDFLEFTVPFTTDTEFHDHLGYASYGFFIGQIHNAANYLEVKKFLNSKDHGAVIVVQMQ